MVKRVFLDSDVILDYLAARKPHDTAAVKIISLLESKKLQGFVSSLIIWNLFYLLSKNFGPTQARIVMRQFRQLIRILPVTAETIDAALASDMRDFEDAVQFNVFKKAKLDIFISRNLKDYPKNSGIVMSPVEYLQSI